MIARIDLHSLALSAHPLAGAVDEDDGPDAPPPPPSGA